jgi:hypothetical protein
MAIPMGILAAVILAPWAMFMGNPVELEMLGAFLGIVGSFLILQVIHTLLGIEG